MVGRLVPVLAPSSRWATRGGIRRAAPLSRRRTRPWRWAVTLAFTAALVASTVALPAAAQPPSVEDPTGDAVTMTGEPGSGVDVRRGWIAEHQKWVAAIVQTVGQWPPAGAFSRACEFGIWPPAGAGGESGPIAVVADEVHAGQASTYGFGPGGDLSPDQIFVLYQTGFPDDMTSVVWLGMQLPGGYPKEGGNWHFGCRVMRTDQDPPSEDWLGADGRQFPGPVQLGLPAAPLTLPFGLPPDEGPIPEEVREFIEALMRGELQVTTEPEATAEPPAETPGPATAGDLAVEASPLSPWWWVLIPLLALSAALWFFGPRITRDLLRRRPRGDEKRAETPAAPTTEFASDRVMDGGGIRLRLPREQQGEPPRQQQAEPPTAGPSAEEGEFEEVEFMGLDLTVPKGRGGPTSTEGGGPGGDEEPAETPGTPTAMAAGTMDGGGIRLPSPGQQQAEPPIFPHEPISLRVLPPVLRKAMNRILRREAMNRILRRGPGGEEQ